ncbi:MAG TPA: AAA family ATPase [Solirubrobacteraceae bacterium]|nr:AAA family ATPase [Solirubrobacteraceae bacterium]
MHSESRREDARPAVQQPWRTLSGTPGWDQLVLPPHNQEALQDLVRLVQTRSTEPGAHSVMALLTGERGTGKTTAARIIAGELGVPLIEIDTFAAASRGPAALAAAVWRACQDGVSSRAVLLFDDAASGLRPGSDPDAVDLPERVADYPGLVLFCSRVSVRLSPEQLPHFNAVIEFPLPEARARERLWRTHLPAGNRLTDADFALLGRSFRLSAGAIADCTADAVRRASESGSPVDHADVAAAVRAHFTQWVLARETEQALHALLSGETGSAPVQAPVEQPVGRAPVAPARGLLRRALRRG